MCILQSLWNTSSTQTTILFNARENLHREGEGEQGKRA